MSPWRPLSFKLPHTALPCPLSHAHTAFKNVFPVFHRTLFYSFLSACPEMVICVHCEGATCASGTCAPPWATCLASTSLFPKLEMLTWQNGGLWHSVKSTALLVLDINQASKRRAWTFSSSLLRSPVLHTSPSEPFLLFFPEKHELLKGSKCLPSITHSQWRPLAQTQQGLPFLLLETGPWAQAEAAFLLLSLCLKQTLLYLL